MGARPLRRAIQRYIEDPLADFVLREQLTPGATVVISPGEGEDDGGVSLSIVQPKKQKVPAGVGAVESGAGAEEISDGGDSHSVESDGEEPELPELSEPDEQ
jgi:ATP-dependent Clp protease ATP-binding subunit ClpC